MDNLLPKQNCGFTLIELVVVILIISILALAISLQWPSTKLNFSAQAEQLAADLRYTQTLSMTHGQLYCLVLSSSTYQIVNSATSTAMILGAGKTTVSLGSGISFGTLVPSGLILVVYDGMGIPYTSTSATCTAANANAATALSAMANIPIVASGQTKTVIISPETGRVSIQ